MAKNPAPSHLPTETDPALRDEFDSYMQGYALTLDPSTPSDAQQRSRRNGLEGERVRKVRSLADLPEILPVPTVAARPTGPLVGESMVFSEEPKPLPRRLIVAPKASAQLSVASRMAYRFRICREKFLSALFLTPDEALEECPSLLPHMIPVVVVNH
jgi:hypothetical protein